MIQDLNVPSDSRTA